MLNNIMQDIYGYIMCGILESFQVVNVMYLCNELAEKIDIAVKKLSFGA